MTFTLEVLWFIVILLSVIFYSILDGFDLGVGALHLFVKKDEERRIFLNSIGPVWDGNEVWLVIVVGALFAGFPEVYATLCSSFYNMVMALLCGLIFRAVAIEFRSKMPSHSWRNGWDRVFSIASLLIAFGGGMLLGNLIWGIPLDSHRDFVGTMRDFFNPYALLVGVTSVALFAMHGSIYLVMKTEGELHDRLHRWVRYTILFFVSSYLVTTGVTLRYVPHMTAHMKDLPILFSIPLIAFFSIFNIFIQHRKRNDGWAFLSSCFSIALLLLLFGIGTFPTMIRSSLDPLNNSLNISNAASSPLTLKILLLIVAIGMPLVMAYGFYVYHIFRGKVKLDKSSY